MPVRFIPPRAANRPTHSLQIRVRDLRSRARPVRRTLADCSWLAAWWNLGLLCGGKDFWQWCVHVALAVLQDSQQPIFNSAALWPWVPIIALLIGAVEAQVLLGSPEFLIRQVGVGPENLYFSNLPRMLLLVVRSTLGEAGLYISGSQPRLLIRITWDI